MTTGSWLKALKPTIGPALDDPPTAPKPLSMDDLAKNIIRARNLRVQAETMVEKVENSIEQTMSALSLQKQEAERSLVEARRIEKDEIAKFVKEAKELGIRPEDLVT